MRDFLKISEKDADRLRSLYFASSKHGAYQPVPQEFSRLIPEAQIDETWRSPNPRIKLLFDQLATTIPGSTIVEIGANTGFQTICLAKEFPHLKFVAVEGTEQHANFLRFSIDLLQIENLIVRNQYILPHELDSIYKNYVVLDFNVLHHAGSDFQSKSVKSVEDWWSAAVSNWFTGALNGQDYWFSSGYRMGGNVLTELHSPDDPSGFCKKLLSHIDIPSGYNVDFWFINSDSGDLKFERCLELEDLNSMLALEKSRSSFKGEYFKRPLLKFSKS